MYNLFPPRTRSNLLLLSLFFLLPISWVRSQDRCELEAFEKALTFLDSGQKDSAQAYLRKAEAHFFQEKNTFCWIRSTGLQAQEYAKAGELEKAIELLDSYLQQSDSFPNISEYVNEFGWYYIIKSRNLSSLGTYQASREAIEKGKEWFEKNRIGASAYQDSIFERSLYINVYPELSKALERVGAYEEALDYVRQAYDYAEEHELSYAYLANLTLIYGTLQEELSDYEGALELNETALTFPQVPNRIRGGLFLNSGVIHYFQGKYNQALVLVDSAIQNYQKAQRNTFRQQGEASMLLGLTYQSLRNYPKAREAFLAAERLGNQFSQSIYNELSAKSLNHLGNLLLEQKDFNGALAYFQESLKRSLPNFTPQKDSEIPDSSLLYSDMQIWAALEGKANSLTQLADFASALQHFVLLDQLDESLRLSYAYESTKLRATAKSRGYYEEAIRTARKLYDQSRDKTYLAQAFAFAEKSKAWVLWEAINQSQAKVNAGIPDSMLNQERTLELQIANLERNIRFERERERPDRELTEEWEREKRGIQLELNRLTDQFEATYPKYYQSKYNLDLVSFEEVQQQLKKNEALLEYFWGDSSLFIFCIRQDQETFQELPMQRVLQTAVHTVQSLVGDQASFSGNIAAAWERFDAVSEELYKYLWRPVVDLLDSGTSVRIIPDGELTRIPFDLLVMSKEIMTLGSSSTKQIAGASPVGRRHYLIYDYSISYDFSATIHEQIASEDSEIPLRCLGIAPTFSGDTRLGLSEVEDNFKGLNAIKNLVAGKYYEGIHASKSNFLGSYDEYGILHFATHGGMDVNDYQNSWLAFTQVAGKPDEGYLRAAEIYQLQDISARLAVLAACETGIGKLQKGEGLMSLARAFAYAGCPALVSSLWRVPANTTNQLLPDFYSGLEQGLSKSDALRQAKLRYLEEHTGIWEFPYFWAAFISTGDQSALVLAHPSTFPFDWRGGIALFLILLAGSFLIRKQTRK